MVEVIEIEDSPVLRPVTNHSHSRSSTRDTNTNSWPTDDIDDDFTLKWAEKPAKKRKVDVGSDVDFIDSPQLFNTRSVFDDDHTITLPKDTSAAALPTWNSDEDDFSISVSSSGRKRNGKEKGTAVLSKVMSVWEGSDDNLGFIHLSQPIEAAKSDRTAGILARLKAGTASKSPNKGRQTSREPSKASPKRKHVSSQQPLTINSNEELSDYIHLPRKKGKTTDADKEAKARERQMAKEEKEKEKAAEKERKRLAKEAQTKEKQLADDLAAVNKLKMHRDDTTKEMILDLSTSLYESRLGTKLQNYMLRLEVQCTSFTSSAPDIVKWRRKAIREWNEAEGRWSPRPEHILDESHILCYLPAKSFNSLVSVDPSDPTAETLSTHVAKLKSSSLKRRPTFIYLIEGIRSLIATARNAQNREHQALVLQQIPSASQESSQPSRRRKANPVISEEAIESALVDLQLKHQVLVHHTNNTDDSAEWIMHFTQHISTIPAKNERFQLNAGTAFCMEAGQVESGKDAKDTWIKMLQEIHGIKANAAHGIQEKWEEVGSLVRGFKDKGPNMMEGIKKTKSSYGGTESRLGPSISRRLHSIFMSLDPESTDI